MRITQFFRIVFSFGLIVSMPFQFTFGARADRARFTIDELQRIITSKKIKSVEELIPQLPADFKRYVTFVHTSQSAQGSSCENPRVIAMDRYADLVLTFNGLPTQEGGDEVEVMAQDEAGKIEMARVDFKSADAKNGSIIERNPAKCIHCHGINPRPLIGSYNRWPGFYGFIEDNLKSDKNCNFMKFKEQYKSNPRYAALSIDNPRNKAFPFELRSSEHVSHFAVAPNIQLTAALSAMRARQSVSNILSHPILGKAVYSILYHDSCPTLDLVSASPQAIKANGKFAQKVYFSSAREIPSLLGISDRDESDEKFQTRLLNKVIPDRHPEIRTGFTFLGFASDNELLQGILFNRLAKTDPQLTEFQRKSTLLDRSNAKYSKFMKEDTSLIGLFSELNMTSYLGSWGLESSIESAEENEEYLAVDERKFQLCQHLEAKSESEIKLLKKMSLAERTSWKDERDVYRVNSDALKKLSQKLSPEESHLGLIALYRAGCIDCHDRQMSGPTFEFSEGQSLRQHVSLWESKTKKSFLQTTQNLLENEEINASKTKVPTQMPPKGPRLSQRETDAIMEYLREQLGRTAKNEIKSQNRVPANDKK